MYPVVVRTPPRLSGGGTTASDIFVILLVIVVIVGAALGKPLIAAIGSLAFVVAIAARIWSRLSLEEVKYSRALSADHLFQGDETTLTLSVENNKPLPVPWLRINDFLPLGLASSDSLATEKSFLGGSEITEVVSLGRYERVRVHLKIRAVERGYYRLGPAKLESGDLFGMFNSSREEGQSVHTVTVYPRVVPAPWLRLPAARPIGDSRTRNNLWEDFSRPSSIREYRPGDPLRKIDWKATARHASQEKVYVRTFDPTVSHYAVALVESATTERPWEGYLPHVLEAAVSCAASVSVRASEMGYRVGMISNGVPPHDEGRAVIPPASSPSHLLDIMKSLAMVKPMAIKSLEEMCRNHGGEALPPGATVIYIAGEFRQGAVEYVASLSHEGYRVVALYVGDAEVPEIPDLEVLDVSKAFLDDEKRSLFARPAGAGEEYSGFGTSEADPVV